MTPRERLVAHLFRLQHARGMLALIASSCEGKSERAKAAGRERLANARERDAESARAALPLFEREIARIERRLYPKGDA